MNQKTCKEYAMLVIMIFYALCGQAQSIRNYSVTYEKKVNLANLYKDWEINDKENKFFKEEFLLTTNSQSSIYKKIPKPDGNNEDNYLSSYMTFSTTFVDIEKQVQVSEKEVGEKTFLMKDSLPKFQWYIYDETKEIAGYTCTKAMAKLQDSIMVVAFFTEDLEASNGPESVGGLPGTILGLVIPRLHTTWLAKSVEKMEANPPKDIAAPKDGVSIKTKELEAIVRKSYSDHPKVNSIVWRVLL